MKQYIALLFLIVLIASCAPKVDVEEAQPVEEPAEVMEEPEEVIEEPEEVIEEPAEVILEEPEETSPENIIEIKGDGFYPVETTIRKNTEIEWVKKDTRDYKLVCYLEGTRVIQSPNLKEGDSFIYTFLKDGEYTCITTPYGLRSKIIVESQQPMLSPTGSAVISESRKINRAPIAAIALIAVVALLFFIYGRKRQ